MATFSLAIVHNFEGKPYYQICAPNHTYWEASQRQAKRVITRLLSQGFRWAGDSVISGILPLPREGKIALSFSSPQTENITYAFRKALGFRANNWKVKRDSTNSLSLSMKKGSGPAPMKNAIGHLATICSRGHVAQLTRPKKGQS